MKTQYANGTLTTTPALDKDGMDFYLRHVAQVEDQDIDSFTILCRVWSDLQKTTIDTPVKYLGLLKNYMQMAKAFHMLPNSKQAVQESGVFVRRSS